MDPLRSSAPLARVLVVLAENQRSTELLARSGKRSARLVVSCGSAVALSGVDGEVLGDSLLRRGALDRARYENAVKSAPPDEPVGTWLVKVGAASHEAVRLALAEQLEARIRSLLRWPELSFELVALERETCLEPVSADLVRPVYDTLRALARELPEARLAVLAGDAELTLSRSGERLVRALEARAIPVDRACLREGPVSHDAALVRAVLRVLGAVVDKSVGADAYSLLLRKRREIRERASARTLLDLADSPLADGAQARRALRRLAHKLHPDRFQGSEPSLCALSGEVMQALSQAEHQLRSGARFGRR